MFLLCPSDYNKAYQLYRRSYYFFPLIATVLLNEQEGLVYANHLDKPTQFYVEHSFGFSQIFGEPDKSFENELEHYLFIHKEFRINKIRLYAPVLPSFLTNAEYQSCKAIRQHFKLANKELISPKLKAGLSYAQVNTDNIQLIERTFGLTSRFWRNAAEFIKKANAVVVYVGDSPASICYSAAEADRYTEIDVLTLENYRHLGLAKYAVLGFIQRCSELSLSPLWDCFTNNEGSMRLCESIGFLPLHEPYPFYTINK
ncbi:GNAT family N-acetyltransferase [Legionella sp. km772]|uniref:GNAT family N-acetyltransferase n=1 Tax=Legionella sp. km772 TaxID=2498111 RepID=UPI000F8EEAD6|nr:GNAT family N-acetyltransferase [Legionella sp. km772]RUR08744.1 GNAT family N-acetyltransferase [Legionella sp. km772]